MTFDPAAPHLPGMVEAEHTRCCFPSRPDWIEPTVDYLRQKVLLCGACDEVRAGRVMMGLHEAVSNAIVHGNLEISSELKESGDTAFAQELARRSADIRYGGRSVSVHVDYDGSECRWTITDEGIGFDVERVMQRDPTTGEEILLSSGRGLLLMRAFFDSMRYEMGGRRLVLTIRKGDGHNPRRLLRHATRQPVRVIPLRDDGAVDWQAAYDGLAHNLSMDGMAVLQAHLATAQRVLIGLDAGSQPLYLPAFVRHCRQVSPDFVELGCQFQPPSQHDPELSSVDAQAAMQAIADLVDRLQGHRCPPDERRAHPRSAYTCTVQITGGGPGEPMVGFGRDLSKGGIAFVTTAMLPPRTCVLTLPTLSGPSIRVVARILRCDRIMDGFFDVGARFEHAAAA